MGSARLASQSTQAQIRRSAPTTSASGTGRIVRSPHHSVGITRLNAYAGIASAYIIRDPLEALLIDGKIIPSNEVPLVIQDKTFVSQAEIDKGYTWGKVGELWYPYVYETNSGGASGRWDYGPDNGQIISDPSKQNLPLPSAIPEFFSDTS